MTTVARNGDQEGAAPDTGGESGRLGGQSRLARRAARLTAVQALYQIELSGSDAQKVVGQFLAGGSGRDTENGEEAIAEADTALFAELVRGTHGKSKEIDEMVSACLDEAWPAARIEVLLRAILRCGAYELSARPDVPARVVISEYIRVADAFFDGKEPALVNAVLDRLARVLRPEELAEAPSG